MTDATAYAFRDPRPLGGAVVTWEYLYLVAAAANVAAVGLEFQALSGANLSDTFTPIIDPKLIDLVSTATRMASFGLYAISGFLFLKWNYRIVANTRAPSGRR